MRFPLISAFALSLFIAAFPVSGLASATDVYITPDGTGQGVCTASPHNPAWFNSSANWGNAQTQIGPGTTVHLCGTFTAPAGADGFLTFQGSGTSGSPVTLLFESGAVVQAPYWGSSNGAISTGSHAYITIDGGASGVLQATANGSTLSNQQDGIGITAINCNSCTIQNLTISNIYVHSSLTDEAGQNSYAARVVGGNNFSFVNNKINDAKWCIFYAYSNTSNLIVSGNAAYNCDHDLAIGGANTNDTLTGLSVVGNTFHDWTNWDDNANQNHHDGMHIWAVSSGDQISGTVNIYDNYVYGDPGIHMTALIFMEANSGGSQGPYNAFNNILVNSSASHIPGNGLVYTQVGNCGWYANTLVSSTTSTGNGFDFAASGCSVKNNVVSTIGTGIYLESGQTFSGSDHNNFYNLNTSGNAMVFHSSFYSSLAAWTSGTGYDPASVNGNPLLDSAYHPQAGSSAIGLGSNLNLGIPQLDNDKAGNPRPDPPHSWDAGIYNFGQQGQPPAPPTGLMATINQ